MDDARKRGLSSAIITFGSDPDELFAPSGLKKLMDDGDRLEALASTGVDGVFAIPFSEEVAALDAHDFLDLAFASETPLAIYVGEDMRFGRGARGDVDALRAWGRVHGMDVVAIPLLKDEGAPITATRIRRALEEGDLAHANNLLGHRYTVCGDVVHGASKGAEMGIRTANLNVPEERMALADGVYAAYAYVGGVPYRCAVSVGLPPTFEGERVSNMEVHIIDFDGDIYGERLCIAFAERLRPMIKFDDVDELIGTIQNDLEAARALPMDDA